MLVDRIEVLALDIDGVLTDGRALLTRDGEEAKGIAFRDLDAITAAQRAGLTVALVTGESGAMVDVIARRLGVEHVVSGAKDKASAVRRLALDLDTPTSRICFVGDADRDAPALAAVGLGLAPSDASDAARAGAHRVLKAVGGGGAVAEAVRLVLDVNARERRDHEVALGKIFAESVEAHLRLVDHGAASLAAIASALVFALRSGHKLMFCGNGGSAADAQHAAAEFIGRFAIERAPLPAIALTTDTSILTAVGNDWTFDDVFARQVRGLARAGDVVVGITTSGKSENVRRALEAARDLGAVAIAFTGAAGGPVADVADLAFLAPDSRTPRVQELHITALHGVCEVVERAMVGRAA